MSLNNNLRKSLENIYYKSSTIYERLNNNWIPDNSEISDAQIQENLEFWCQIVAKGEQKKFKQRLAFEGWNLENISSILGEGSYPLNTSFPEWVNILEEIIKKALDLDFSQLPDSVINSTQIPFEPIYTPFIQVAWNRLNQKIHCDLKLLSNDCLITLEKQLINQIAYIFTGVLLEEFKKFRSSGSEMKDFILFQLKGGKSKEKYHQFLKDIFADGFLSFFQKYSVLARLSAIIINYWIEANQEFVVRLNQDLSNIETVFSPEQSLTKVIDIQVGLSDSHERGRTVIAVKFNTGLKLIYKPRNVSLDVAFYQFLTWFNGESNLLPLKIIKIIKRDNYGWIEFLESLPCESEQEAKNFYYRYGMLIAITYVLEGSDFHFENLISHGQYPMLIDLEGLLQPRTKNHNDEDVSSHGISSAKLIEDSVFRTLLVPIEYSFLNENVNFNVGGMAVEQSQEIEKVSIKNINTDAMNLAVETVIFAPQNNLPVLNDVVLSPKDYLEDIVQGFEESYLFLLKSKQYLLRENSPFFLFENQNTRYLFRNTNTYNNILVNSYHPSLLTSGVKRSIAIDVLSRAFLAMDNPQRVLPILKAELEEMEGLDIPCFSANTSSNSIYLANGETVTDMFEMSSFDSVMSRFQNCDEEDLIRQREMIRSAFYAQLVKQPLSIFSKEIEDENLSDSGGLNQDLLWKQVLKIGDELAENAIVSVDGVAWLGLEYRPQNNGFRFPNSNIGLYDGNGGITLFLSALYKLTGDEKWKDLTDKGIQTIQTMIKQLISYPTPRGRFIKKMGISGTKGIASLVYSLVKISELLEKPILLANAEDLVSLITPELINQSLFTVIDGVASTILALLALSQTQFASESIKLNALKGAIASGEYLLDYNQKNGLTKTGFAHGLAGIGYSFLRLFAVTEDKRFFEAGIEAIKEEQKYFSSVEQNWADDASENPTFHNCWTNGASGIALARLGALDIYHDSAIEADINNALETTQKYCLGEVDNLCWGNFGRLETLLVASQKLDNPQLLELSHQRVNYLLHKAESRGKFQLFSDLPTLIFNPSFYHGSSGIGYQLLRFAYPDLLPSILLWE